MFNPRSWQCISIVITFLLLPLYEKGHAYGVTGPPDGCYNLEVVWVPAAPRLDHSVFHATYPYGPLGHSFISLCTYAADIYIIKSYLLAGSHKDRSSASAYRGRIWGWPVRWIIRVQRTRDSAVHIRSGDCISGDVVVVVTGDIGNDRVHVAHDPVSQSSAHQARNQD